MKKPKSSKFFLCLAAMVYFMAPDNAAAADLITDPAEIESLRVPGPVNEGLFCSMMAEEV